MAFARDPLAALGVLLRAGFELTLSVPAESAGNLALLQESTPSPFAEDDELDAWGEDVARGGTAYRTHHSRRGFSEAVRSAFAWYGWVENSTSAVIICADTLEAARWQAKVEGWLRDAPGVKHFDASVAVVLVDDLLDGESAGKFDEVFLAGGCNALNPAKLIPAIQSARLGVHVLDATGAN
jgi:hypothetical protein